VTGDGPHKREDGRRETGDETGLFCLRLHCGGTQVCDAHVLRSSLSVQLNIAEGYAIAHGSAVETTEICGLLVDTGIVASEEARELLTLLRRSRELCWGLVTVEKARRKKGAEEPGRPSPVSRLHPSKAF
jgi:hypothetical protein